MQITFGKMLQPALAGQYPKGGPNFHSVTTSITSHIRKSQI